ncbi:MAG: LuxR C-terminal-related transcriptional regulator, partial [Ectothiorhodospiraceae bacterium]
DRTDAAAVLETLDENRLFIFRLDDQRTWYRYHHLFQDFLQTRLLRLEESHRGELYARASRWCEEVGATSEAIDYALRGGLTERAAELLMGYGRILFRAGRFKELRLRAQQIPDDIRARSATLCALEAWAFAYLGDFAAARKCLAEAEAAANTRDSAQGGPLGAELCVLQAALSVIQTDDPGVSGLGPDLAVRLKDADPAVRAFGYVVMAYASRASGDLGEAEGYLNQAVEISETVGSALVTLLAYFNLGTLDWLRGRPLSVESRLQRAADLAERAHWQHTMGAAFVRVQLGIALHDADRLEEAETELTRAVAILEATQAFGFLGVALVSRASVRWSRGDEDDAEADLENAERLGESRGIPRVLFRASLVRAAMSLARGSLAEVDRLMTDARSRLTAGTTDHPATCDERDEQVALLEIRRELLARRPAPALELAEVVEESAAASGRLRSWIEASALKAEALAALQRWEEAKEALQPALERASPERLIQPFLIAGANLGRVVQSLADSGHPFARLLAASMRRAAKRKSGDALDMQNRERQILALMEQGLSNSEIGERLCLSGETVKWYLKGIYRKLDVHNRTAAITRARDLDLIG